MSAICLKKAKMSFFLNFSKFATIYRLWRLLLKFSTLLITWFLFNFSDDANEIDDCVRMIDLRERVSSFEMILSKFWDCVSSSFSNFEFCFSQISFVDVVSFSFCSLTSYFTNFSFVFSFSISENVRLFATSMTSCFVAINISSHICDKFCIDNFTFCSFSLFRYSNLALSLKMFDAKTLSRSI